MNIRYDPIAGIAIVRDIAPVSPVIVTTSAMKPITGSHRKLNGERTISLDHSTCSLTLKARPMMNKNVANTMRTSTIAHIEDAPPDQPKSDGQLAVATE